MAEPSGFEKIVFVRNTAVGVAIIGLGIAAYFLVKKAAGTANAAVSAIMPDTDTTLNIDAVNKYILSLSTIKFPRIIPLVGDWKVWYSKLSKLDKASDANWKIAQQKRDAIKEIADPKVPWTPADKKPPVFKQGFFTSEVDPSVFAPSKKMY